MVMINKGQIQKSCTDLLDLKKPIQEAQNFIQPIIDVGQNNCTILKRAEALNSTAATIYTTENNIDMDFYLCGMSLSVIKDVTSTSTNSRIAVFLEGQTSVTYPLEIAGITLTPQNESIAIDFNRPLKLAKSSTIQVLNATNVANIRTCGSIWGFYK